MIRRAWILLSLLWSAVWIIGANLSTEGKPMPEFTAMVAFVMALLPWVIGRAAQWIIAGR